MKKENAWCWGRASRGTIDQHGPIEDTTVLRREQQTRCGQTEAGLSDSGMPTDARKKPGHAEKEEAKTGCWEREGMAARIL